MPFNEHNGYSTLHWEGIMEARKSFLRTPLILCVLPAFLLGCNYALLWELFKWSAPLQIRTSSNHWSQSSREKSHPNPLRNPSWPHCTTTRPLGRLALTKTMANQGFKKSFTSLESAIWFNSDSSLRGKSEYTRTDLLEDTDEDRTSYKNRNNDAKRSGN